MYVDVLNNISSPSFFKTVALNRINWYWCPLKLQLTPVQKMPITIADSERSNDLT